MAESRQIHSSVSSSGGTVVNERVTEENDEAKKNSHRHHRETHGLRDDIDEETPMNDVKAPNVFERAKEEIEALVEAVHLKKEAKNETRDKERNSGKSQEFKSESPDSHSAEKNGKSPKSPNIFERAKEDIEALIHKQKSPHRHHKETHGRSNDFDENTPISEFKGPSVFHRAKEEIEALVDSIHLKKSSDGSISSSKRDGGFRKSIGKGLEKICSPGNHNKD